VTAKPRTSWSLDRWRSKAWKGRTIPKTEDNEELRGNPSGANPVNDPKHWRDRAAEARAMADLMSDADARQKMLGVADGYDELAKGAQQKLSSS
jgi:hypothetical protein